MNAILFMSDESTVAALRPRLDQLGYRVLSIGIDEIAVQWLTDEQPQLIISAWELVGSTAEHFLTRAIAYARNHKVTLVGYVDDDDHFSKVMLGGFGIDRTFFKNETGELMKLVQSITPRGSD